MVKNGPKNLKKSPKIRKNSQFDKKMMKIYFWPFWTHFDPFGPDLGKFGPNEKVHSNLI